MTIHRTDQGVPLRDEPPLEGARALPARSHLRRDRLLLVAGLLIAWEVSVRTGIADPLFVAPPTDIILALRGLVSDPEIRRAFFQTTTILFLAFAIGSGSAVLIGTWLGLVPQAYRAFLPFISLGMATPKMIFLPLIIVMFGIGGFSTVFYGALAAFFFTVPNISTSVRMLDQRLVTAVKSMGASRRQTFIHLVIPGSLPGVVTGLWYGVKHALLSVLVAELFISQKGIGFYINRYTSSFQVDKVYAIILGLSLVAVGIGWAFRMAEQRLDKWRPAS